MEIFMLIILVYFTINSTEVVALQLKEYFLSYGWCQEQWFFLLLQVFFQVILQMQKLGNLFTPQISRSFLFRESHLAKKLRIINDFSKDVNLNPDLTLKLKKALEYHSFRNVFNKNERNEFFNEIPIELKFQVEQKYSIIKYIF